MGVWVFGFGSIFGGGVCDGYVYFGNLFFFFFSGILLDFYFFSRALDLGWETHTHTHNTSLHPGLEDTHGGRIDRWRSKRSREGWISTRDLDLDIHHHIWEKSAFLLLLFLNGNFLCFVTVIVFILVFMYLASSSSHVPPPPFTLQGNFLTLTLL